MIEAFVMSWQLAESADPSVVDDSAGGCISCLSLPSVWLDVVPEGAEGASQAACSGTLAVGFAVS